MPAPAPQRPVRAGISPEAVYGLGGEHRHDMSLTPLTELPPTDNPFRPAPVPKCITRTPMVNGQPLAMDDGPDGGAWGGYGLVDSDSNPWSLVGGFTNFNEGIGFFGYAYLSQLAQRPEYRKITETIATEMTREWIEITYQGDEGGRQAATDKIKQIEEQLEKWKVKDVFRTAIEHDGFFGRGQIYIDLDIDDDDDEELASILVLDKRKIKPKKVKGFKNIEPLWSYPNEYNTTNPLAKDFYKPTSWLVMSKRIHNSRLLLIVSRPVPDILKPAYAFGGLSMSQIAKPYIDNWLRTRQSVSDIIHSFTVFVLKTELGTVLQGGDADQLKLRADLFNKCRDNRGLMMVQNGAPGEGEELENVSMPLTTLDALQAQSQEQMASISGIPMVKLMGTTPSGLNASSDGEIRVFYDTINANQERLLRHPVETVIKITQLHLFGEIDDNIGFEFKELWQQDESEQAVTRKSDADVDVNYINAGVLQPEEVRLKLAADKNSPYSNIDVSDKPDDPALKEMMTEVASAAVTPPDVHSHQHTELPGVTGNITPPPAPMGGGGPGGVGGGGGGFGGGGKPSFTGAGGSNSFKPPSGGGAGSFKKPSAGSFQVAAGDQALASGPLVVGDAMPAAMVQKLGLDKGDLGPGHWITVHSGGGPGPVRTGGNLPVAVRGEKKGGGHPVFIGPGGEIKAGMGGKFNGMNISELGKKKDENKGAGGPSPAEGYNPHRERAKARSAKALAQLKALQKEGEALLAQHEHQPPGKEYPEPEDLGGEKPEWLSKVKFGGGNATEAENVEDVPPEVQAFLQEYGDQIAKVNIFKDKSLAVKPVSGGTAYYNDITEFDQLAAKDLGLKSEEDTTETLLNQLGLGGEQSVPEDWNSGLKMVGGFDPKDQYSDENTGALEHIPDELKKFIAEHKDQIDTVGFDLSGLQKKPDGSMMMEVMTKGENPDWISAYGNTPEETAKNLIAKAKEKLGSSPAAPKAEEDLSYLDAKVPGKENIHKFKAWTKEGDLVSGQQAAEILPQELKDFAKQYGDKIQRFVYFADGIEGKEPKVRIRIDESTVGIGLVAEMIAWAKNQIGVAPATPANYGQAPAVEPQPATPPLPPEKPIKPSVAKGALAKIAKPVPLSSFGKYEKAKSGGSNPGGYYRDKDGTLWLVKGNKQLVNGAVDKTTSDKRAQNEVLAAQLMNAAMPGSAPEMRMVDLGGEYGGGLGVASKVVEGAKMFDKYDLAAKEAIQSTFAVQAWLANYDAVGMDYDNTMLVDGKPVNIDPGGALLFRAQGKPKGSAFNDKADEWESMRGLNPNVSNPSAAFVFGSMTSEQLVASAKQLDNVTDTQIRKIAEALMPGEPGLADTLIKRKAAIKAKAAAEAKKPKAEKIEAMPSHHAISKAKELWNGNSDHLSQGMKEAIQAYTGSTYHDINSALRKGATPAGYIKEKIDNLKAAFKTQAGVMKHDVVGYRCLGVNMKDFLKVPSLNPDDVIGTVFEDKGFASTTLNLEHAQGRSEGYDHAFVKVSIKKGQKAMAVAKLSSYDHEAEILVQNGTKFKITGVKSIAATSKYSKPYTMLECEIIEQNG